MNARVQVLVALVVWEGAAAIHVLYGWHNTLQASYMSTCTVSITAILRLAS
jgi:hypothetical protein